MVLSSENRSTADTLRSHTMKFMRALAGTEGTSKSTQSLVVLETAIKAYSELHSYVLMEAGVHASNTRDCNVFEET